MIYAFNIILTFGITALLFDMIFKVLPDARIKWGHVRAGALLQPFFLWQANF
jgi:membrane protein